MAIALGWRPKDTRHSYWRGDPAVEVLDADAYERTADRAHCRVRDGQSADLITFRALTHVEEMFVLTHPTAKHVEAYQRMTLAFRIACRFPDRVFHDAHGAEIASTVSEHGFEMLSSQIIGGLYDSPQFGPEAIAFYGGRVMVASRPSDADFLASSPASTAPSGPTVTAPISSASTAAPSSSDGMTSAPT